MKRYVLISEEGVVETDTTSLARAKQYVEAALVDKPTGYTVSIYQHVLTGSKTGVVFSKDGCTKRTNGKAKPKAKPIAKTREEWTEEEISTLKALFGESYNRGHLCKAFPRHTSAGVDYKRKQLGLKYRAGRRSKYAGKYAPKK
jgi:hypothetical protein